MGYPIIKSLLLGVVFNRRLCAFLVNKFMNRLCSELFLTLVFCIRYFRELLFCRALS